MVRRWRGGSTATFRCGIAETSRKCRSVTNSPSSVIADYPRELSLDLLQNDVRNDRVVQKVVEGLLGKAQPLGSILRQDILSAAGRLCSEPICQYGVLIRCEEIDCTAKH
jgi:hypothetical protein